MRGGFETLKVLVLIAFRNLFASRVKTLIVGGIILFGAMLVVVGSSLLDSVNGGIKRSVIDSIAGHLQVYNSNSKDDLALFGSMGGDADLKPVEDFSKLKAVVEKVDNVKAIIPMGTAEAMASGGNAFDRALEKLRAAQKTRDGAGTEEQYRALKDHVRWMISLLEHDLATAHEMISTSARDPGAAEDLTRAASDGFWADFDQDPLANLEFLENKIAPQAVDGDMLWVRYIGTDLDTYFKNFDRVEIIEGTRVPKGQRGILFGSLYYEDWLKLKNARRLDKIRDARTINHKTIAKSEELQRFVKENTSQVREIMVQLDAVKARTVVERLQKALNSTEADCQKLLVELFQTDDQNFDARYQIFYSQVAPLLQLYQIRVGDTMTIKAATKAGYMKSVNVKVYGIFQFKGIDRSSFSGILSLMDLMSLRDLYGYMTADKAEEIKQLKAASGTREIAREDAEAALFGGGSAKVVTDAKAQTFDVELAVDTKAIKGDADRVYTQDEIDKGIAINAAILLKDPTKIEQTRLAIAKAVEGAGLPIKVVDWQKAAGMVGQLITLLRGVLSVAVFIIFVIALVIINNAMVMATLQRVKEIGTLRAVGAQRRFVLSMVTLETVVVGLFFGTLGALLGAGVIKFLGAVGIGAPNEDTMFLFSGPRLFPVLSASNLIVAFVVVFVVSVLSGLYPAVLATRITPLEAMQSEE